MTTYIDPPEGWKYGFPKILPPDVQDLDEWLVAEGYPQELVDSGLTQHCRMWMEQEDPGDCT